MAKDFPFINISPEVGVINLFISFKVVVLPHPLEPIKTTRLPLSIVKEILSSIFLSPICLDTFFISIIKIPLFF